MIERRSGVAAAGLLVALVSAGCASPQPSVSPTQSASPTQPAGSVVPTLSAAPSPSPSTSPIAAEPTVVCHSGTVNHDATKPIVSTLTCEAAVAAARKLVGADPAVTSIEFAFGAWCPPGWFCALELPNTGHVVLHRDGHLPDLRVVVVADEAGKVTATGPFAMPTPSPSGAANNG